MTDLSYSEKLGDPLSLVRDILLGLPYTSVRVRARRGETLIYKCCSFLALQYVYLYHMSKSALLNHFPLNGNDHIIISLHIQG